MTVKCMIGDKHVRMLDAMSEQNRLLMGKTGVCRRLQAQIDLIDSDKIWQWFMEVFDPRCNVQETIFMQ
jgi:hypothetical protein